MTVSTPLSGINHPFKGILLIVLATFLFSSHDALSKYLAGFYPIVMVVWARYLVHTLLMAGIFLPQSGLRVLRSKRPGMQVVRALCLLGTSLFFTAALHYIPLAEATAVNFLAPILVTALSVPLLGEHVTRGQWLAVICGFIGVLVIIHPGGELFAPAVLLPLCSALFFCFYQLLTRILSKFDTPHHQQLLCRAVQYLGDERHGAVLLADPHAVAWRVDAGPGHVRHDRALDADPSVSLRGAGFAGAVRLLPDRVCGVVGLAGVQPYPRCDHGGRHRGDLHERVGRCLAAAAQIAQTVAQTSTVGILRGAMKYIQVSAMKYIAGIRVNNTV